MWGAILGAGASLLGGLGGAVMQRDSQREANYENRMEAQRNRDFQERMSNTSWQRGVKDMEAAGINPMLAVSQGGASQPQGGQATMESEMKDVDIQRVINSAKENMMAKQQLKNLKAKELLDKNAARAQQELANLHNFSAESVRLGLPQIEMKNRAWKYADSLMDLIEGKAKKDPALNQLKNRLK